MGVSNLSGKRGAYWLQGISSLFTAHHTGATFHRAEAFAAYFTRVNVVVVV